jgi:peptidyl-prolyl cis-trans isomerase A (cyclophilin A)
MRPIRYICTAKPRNMRKPLVALSICYALLSALPALHSCTKPVFKSKWIAERSPETFITRIETSKGSFDIRVDRYTSPYAADRYYQLVKHHFYDNAIFYRVIPHFVAQFGISDTVTITDWKKNKIPDEAVLKSNTRGTLSFARSGKQTRGSELFFNLVDNPRLDTVNFAGVTGFPAFGDVIRGMEVVDSIYSGYGMKIADKLDTMYTNRPRFLAIFPKLDLIKKVYIVNP